MLRSFQKRIGKTGVDEADSLLVAYGACEAILAVTCHARIPSPSGIYGSKGFIMMYKTHMADHCELYDKDFSLVERYAAPFENGLQFEIEHMCDCIRKGALQSDIALWQMTLDCAAVFEQVLTEP